MITLTAFRWVPPYAQGQVRDLRERWALEEAGIPYREWLIGPEDLATAAYRALQPFGQVPAIETGELKLFRVRCRCAPHRRKLRSADAARSERAGADDRMDVRRIEFGRTPGPGARQARRFPCRRGVGGGAPADGRPPRATCGRLGSSWGVTTHGHKLRKAIVPSAIGTKRRRQQR